MKARTVKEVKKFQDIPNIGPAMERDFVLIDLKNPKDLQGKDPLALYKKICHIRGVRQDPCVLDVYMAAVDFMNGKPAHPWWHYTKIRKNTEKEVSQSLKIIHTLSCKSGVCFSYYSKT